MDWRLDDGRHPVTRFQKRVDEVDHLDVVVAHPSIPLLG